MKSNIFAKVIRIGWGKCTYHLGIYLFACSFLLLFLDYIIVQQIEFVFHSLQIFGRTWPDVGQRYFIGAHDSSSSRLGHATPVNESPEMKYKSRVSRVQERDKRSTRTKPKKYKTLTSEVDESDRRST